MTKCPKCGRIVIDLARNEEGEVVGCRNCYKSPRLYGRSLRCEQEDRELTRVLHNAGLREVDSSENGNL
jgi:DNA-directed RNA polymerase subunit M/transcription elongation factor TFIIS